MTTRAHNPFASNELRYPTNQREDYQRFCSPGGRAGNDRQPFPRMVDLWFAGLCLAARRSLMPADLAGQDTVYMVGGDILGSDQWRVQVIMLTALARDDDVEVVDNPARMMAMANGLAAAGVPYIVEMLSEGREPPIWNLSNATEHLLTEGNAN